MICNSELFKDAIILFPRKLAYLIPPEYNIKKKACKNETENEKGCMFKQTHVNSMYESSALSNNCYIYPHNKPAR